MDIGTTIKELRKAQGLTIVQLAEASGVSVGNIHNIENSRRDSKLSYLLKVAKGLGTTLPEILLIAMKNAEVAPEVQEKYNLILKLAESLRKKL